MEKSVFIKQRIKDSFSAQRQKIKRPVELEVHGAPDVFGVFIWELSRRILVELSSTEYGKTCGTDSGRRLCSPACSESKKKHILYRKFGIEIFIYIPLYVLFNHLLQSGIYYLIISRHTSLSFILDILAATEASTTKR